MSLVVPDISVTIALSSSKSVFNKDDFPTFGRPIMAMFKPFLIISPFLDSFIIFFKDVFISFKLGSIFSLVITSSSVYSG